ncbi:hypothetical protein M3P05_04550 [Sansalvadorimonas sp. 2012CJ34-2]|uniref:Uncharacterized protein n=1 Tax=Parendozoicomonas callyspongiae TaxID=2942213 RepID=A0ABT0PCV8_9GAMM|nr:hypothetical protein [Sansalvadorimonas sp. 2012CJ34-2]MCL6269214.1 hypothetical protein [Sansalvadorimonas sp. 2012CJ34-2]
MTNNSKIRHEQEEESLMIKDLLDPKELFRKIRWIGICLVSALCVAFSFLVTAQEDGYSTAQSLDVVVKLNISHRIKVTQMEAGELVLLPGPNEVASGSKNYCVITNNAEQKKAKVAVSPVSGGAFVLKSAGKQDVPIDVKIADTSSNKSGDSVPPNKQVPVSAVATEKDCAQTATQLFVSAQTKNVQTGNYNTTLKLTFSAE